MADFRWPTTSGSSSSKASTTTKTPASFYGTPATTFPQYTSGSWANLPTGTMGGPPPTPATPTPNTPALSGNALRSKILGIIDPLHGGSPLTGFSPEDLAILNQGWSLFGGGQPMPTTKKPYAQALLGYNWGGGSSGGNPSSGYGGLLGGSSFPGTTRSGLLSGLLGSWRR